MLNTNAEFFRAEILDVLRAFDSVDEDFTHYFSYSCGTFFNSIEYKNDFYDFEDSCEIENDLVFKRLAKRSVKLAFYKVLSKFKGNLPWGALTGIRPTKLAYAEASAGKDFKALFENLGVCEANILLTERVLNAQRGVYRKGGQDLFVSVPFCPTKCEYCSFITAPIDKTKQYVDSYLNCLVKEIYSLKPLLTDLRSVYIGGGTPFVLSCEQLRIIFSALSKIGVGNTEFTVEAGRPDVFDEEKLKLCKEFGVTRVCVNPQTFSDATLNRIGRRHTSEQTIRAFEMTKKYGFDVNLDLIAGLADETVNDFEKSVKASVLLQPENITVHTLSLKSGAKLKENVEKLSVKGVNEMINLSREILTDAGYEPYYMYRQKYQAGGLENVGWTKQGKACVYNIDVMEETSDNIAVGANAISKRVFGDEDRIERYAAPKDIPTYINKTDKIISERINLFS